MAEEETDEMEMEVGQAAAVVGSGGSGGQWWWQWQWWAVTWWPAEWPSTRMSWMSSSLIVCPVVSAKTCIIILMSSAPT